MIEKATKLSDALHELVRLHGRIFILEKALTQAHYAMHNSQTEAIFSLAVVHGQRYTGPTFTRDEFDKAMECK